MTTQNLNDPFKPSGPVTVHGLSIRVDRDLCIGAGTCVALAPKAFVLDDEAKAVILETADQETIETIIMAAQACPARAIIIENDKGEVIAPT